MSVFVAQIGVERLDWFGFGAASANRTGAFIACLIAVVWTLYACRIKWVSVLAWASTLALFYFLVQTASRGALVSLVCSGIFFLILAGFKPSRNITAAVLLWCGCAALIFLQSKLCHRMEEMVSLQSSSANCRMDIYMSGLKMLTDAPCGFVRPESPIKAYMQWYQNPNDSERYLSMINSHLEFLCANAIPLRLVYAGFWVFVFALLFPRPRAILPAACFSVWFCFALCATFSNVANYWVLWTVPAVSFIIGAFYNGNRLKNLHFYSLVLFLSFFVCFALHAISYFLPKNASLFFYRNGDVLVGRGIPKTVIFRPNEGVVGAHYGAELAIAQEKVGSAVLVSNNIPQNSVDKLLICASLPGKTDKINAKEVIYFNTMPPNDMSKHAGSKIVVVVGSFANWRIRRAWEKVASCNKYDINFHVLDGVAEYIPNWSKFVLNEIN